MFVGGKVMDGDGYLMGAFASFMLGTLCLILGVFATHILIGHLVLIGAGCFMLLFGYLGIYLYKQRCLGKGQTEHPLRAKRTD
jgi:hypothetical protein